MESQKHTNNRSNDTYFSTGTISSELIIAGNVYCFNRFSAENVLC
jgi:hypothetical protein